MPAASWPTALELLRLLELGFQLLPFREVEERFDVDNLLTVHRGGDHGHQDGDRVAGGVR